MRVGLIGTKEGYGAFSFYTKNLYTGLLREGVDVHLLWVKIPQVPLGQTFHHVFLMPKQILKVVNQFDILHATQPGFTLCFPIIRGPAKIVTFYDIFPILRPSDFSDSIKTRMVNFVWFSIWLQTSQSCDKIIAVSSQTKADLLTLGIPEEKIAVVSLWVRPTLRKVKMKKTGIVIGYVGAISHRKDVKFVVSAFSEFTKKYPNSELWLCGSCSDLHYKMEIEHMIRRLGLKEKIKFEEYLSDERLSEIYSSLDCFVSGTLCEGFGLPILEAKKFGIPVIVRKTAVIPPEVKKHCIEVESPQEMAERIAEVVEGKAEKITSRAIADAARFTLERAIKQTIHIYESCLNWR
jgi:glycosyltransferase involved in cell wall biosynthesis